jgi:hypothetical protein
MLPRLRQAQAARRKADEAAEGAARLTREAVVCLRDELGMPYTEIGKLLGLTSMRIYQILKESR